METLEETLSRVVREGAAVVLYDPLWMEIFERERLHLLSCLPADLIKRTEHFGSTAVPGLSAKPVVGMLVETTGLTVLPQAPTAFTGTAGTIPPLDAEQSLTTALRRWQHWGEYIR